MYYIKEPVHPDHTKGVLRCKEFPVGTMIPRFANTKSSYKHRAKIRYLLKDLYGDRVKDLVKEVTPSELDGLVVKFYSRHSSKSLELLMDVLRDFYNFLVLKKVYYMNPVNRYKPISKPTFFSKLQCDIIFRDVKGDLRNACLIMYHTGLKLEEARKVEIKDDKVYLKGREILCPSHILPLLRIKKKLSDYTIKRQFAEYLLKKEISGYLHYLRNSFIARLYLSKMPVSDILTRVSTDKYFGRKIVKLFGAAQYKPSTDFIDYF